MDCACTITDTQFYALHHIRQRKGDRSNEQIQTIQSGGGARNFPTGAESSDEGAKIWFSGYYEYQKSPKKSLSPSDGGL